MSRACCGCWRRRERARARACARLTRVARRDWCAVPDASHVFCRIGCSMRRAPPAPPPPLSVPDTRHAASRSRSPLVSAHMSTTPNPTPQPNRTRPQTARGPPRRARETLFSVLTHAQLTTQRVALSHATLATTTTTTELIRDQLTARPHDSSRGDGHDMCARMQGGRARARGHAQRECTCVRSRRCVCADLQHGLSEWTSYHARAHTTTCAINTTSTG